MAKMVSADRETTGAPEQYFVDVAELRVAIERNIDDYRFSTELGGQIIYVFDSNILQFFVTPRADASVHVAVFHDQRDEEYLAGTGVITAEFLFSRSLAGQNGAAPYISPSHSDELGRIINQLRKKIDEQRTAHEGAPRTEPANAKIAVENLVETMRAEVDAQRDPRDKLLNGLPDIVRKLFEGPSYEATQFKRLYDNDLIRPLSLDRFATMEVLAPPQKKVKAWVDRIEREHRRSSQDPMFRLEHGDKEKIKRDAKTITQVLTLQDLANENIQPTRYVFVTADKNVYKAFSRWFWGNDEDRFDQDDYNDGIESNIDPKDPSQFIIRHPSQYIPLLNTLEMPNGIENDDIIVSIKNALDSLLAHLIEKDPKYYPHSLSGYTSGLFDGLRPLLSDFYGRDFLALVGGTHDLDEVKERWRNVSMGAVGLNIELLSRRAEAELEPLRDLLSSSKNLRNSVAGAMDTLANQVESAHLVFLMRGIVAQFGEQSGSAVTQSGSGPSRSPISIRTDFKNVIGERRLNDFLDEIVSRPSDRSIEDLYETLRTQLDYRVALLVGCVALRASKWETARYYGERARNLISAHERKSEKPSEEIAKDRNEILHFIALVIRTILLDLKDVRNLYYFNLANKYLNESIDFFSEQNDVFGVARGKVELATLYMAIAYRRAILPDTMNVIDDQRAKALGKQASKLLHDARDHRRSGRGAATEGMHERLDMQMHTNTISSALLGRYFAHDNGWHSIDDLRESLTFVENAFDSHSQQYPQHLLIDRHLLLWALASGAKERREHETTLRNICRDISHEDQEVTRMDRAQVDWVHAILNRDHGESFLIGDAAREISDA